MKSIITFFNHNIYFTIYFAILLVGICVGIYNWRKLLRGSRILLLLLPIILLVEFSALGIGKMGVANIVIYNFFAPIYYTFIAMAYYQEFKSRLLLLSILLVAFVDAIISIKIESLSKINSYFFNIMFFCISIISINYLRKLLYIKTDYNFTSFPFFWISCGFLLFSVANIFVFGTYNSFFKTDSILSIVFAYIRIFTNYILYILFIIAFLSSQKSLKQ